MVLNQDCRQLVNRPIQIVVDHVNIISTWRARARAGRLPAAAGSWPRRRCPGPAAAARARRGPAPARRSRGRSGTFSRTWKPPCTSITRITQIPCGQGLAHRLGGRPVAMAVDLGRLEKLVADASRTPRGDRRRNRGRAARRAGGARVVAETETCSRRLGPLEQPLHQRALARARGPERTISRPGRSSSQSTSHRRDSQAPRSHSTFWIKFPDLLQKHP